MRSVFSVLIGYVVFVLGTVVFGVLIGGSTSGGGVDLLTATYGMVFAAAGGFVTAKLSGRARLRHALALGGVIAVVSVAALVSGSHSGFPWPEWATILLVAPSAVLGGMFAVRIR